MKSHLSYYLAAALPFTILSDLHDTDTLCLDDFTCDDSNLVCAIIYYRNEYLNNQCLKSSYCGQEGFDQNDF